MIRSVSLKQFRYVLLIVVLLQVFNNKVSAQCRDTLWRHVYHSYRFSTHDSCMAVTGYVQSLIYEADGDIHIRLTVDTPFRYMLNSANFASEYGKLVLEPVCATTCTQADAIASCAGFTNTVYIPAVGEYVQATGSYVTDNDHGWNELHPVSSIRIVPLETNFLPAPSFTGVTIYPNPAKDHITFHLNEKPTSPVRITLQDAVGRSAGQYQLLNSQSLDVTTSYLPAGSYVFHVEQGDNYIQKGTFVVIK